MATIIRNFTSCVLSRAALPFYLNATDYITWLSNYIYWISEHSLAEFETTYSAHQYFTRAIERWYLDAANADYEDLDAWAKSLTDISHLYHLQQIPATEFDGYYRAAEVARESGYVRKRMPFHRPAFGGTTYKCTPAQRPIRRIFRGIVDRFNLASYTDRQDIYQRSLETSLWYYNFFIASSAYMIKRIWTSSVDWNWNISPYIIDVWFTEEWNMERTLVIMPNFFLDGTYGTNTTEIKMRPVYWNWIMGPHWFRIVCDWPAAYPQWFIPVTLIEFY